MDDNEPIRVTLDLTETNLDKMFLSAASLDETPQEVANRAIAFYHVVMAAKPGDVIKWEFADGSRGRIRRLA